MTNGLYRSNEAYAAWNERPTEEWLISNGFTYVLEFQEQQSKGQAIAICKTFASNDAARLIYCS